MSITQENNSHILSGLYIVATPIGNLEDITLRAVKILGAVDYIACEDSKMSLKLLSRLGISKKLISYNEQSNEKDRINIANMIQNGKSIALISDAGTPLISDPGYKLVALLKSKDLRVHSIPGPCAIITALVGSGLPSNNFYFSGFLPPKDIAKRNFFIDLLKRKEVIICYESPRRLLSSLEILADLVPNRLVNVSRELTKIYEEQITATATSVYKIFKDREDIKGEIVLIIGPKEEVDIQNIDDMIIALLAENPVKEVVNIVHMETNLSKKEIYKRCLELKDKDEAQE